MHSALFYSIRLQWVYSSAFGHSFGGICQKSHFIFLHLFLFYYFFLFWGVFAIFHRIGTLVRTGVEKPDRGGVTEGSD